MIGVALVSLAALVWVLVPRPGLMPQSTAEIHRERLELKEGRLHRAGDDQPFTGWMLDTNAMGILLSRSFLSNGVLEGVSEGYYTNGQKQVTEHFKAGVSHGIRTKWHPGGLKESEVRIVNGKLEGVYLRWDPDGFLAEEVNLLDGEPHGLSRSYYPSGFVKAEARMRHGRTVEQQFWADGEQPH